MDTIELRPDLQQGLEHNAMLEARSVNDLVNEAVGQLLRGRQRETIARETVAYERMHAPRLTLQIRA